ncbi:hypothetical protein [Paraburkholderia atlantica]|uniref:hypothetical protein n=1 Tax=Paraburkholderia atlantica TaxID=2654982 RepID=UPI003D1C8D27
MFAGERCAGNAMANTRLAMPVLEQDIKCLRISSELRRICPDGFGFCDALRQRQRLDGRYLPRAGR